MRFISIISLVLLFLPFGINARDLPQTLIINVNILQRNKMSADDSKKGLIKSLAKEADKIVKSGKLYSVMNKEQIPPSGDKHDYMSQAPYWWADPAKPNGLPYIRRDGETNPELKKITDKDELGDLIDDSEICAAAYFFTGNEIYASCTAKLLKTWFLDPKTKQNPNLNFGQGIPGINTGRGIGLIETRELYRVIDAAILIQGSRSWLPENHLSLKKWFAEFSKWMLESDLGKDELKAKNNHGTHYDVQIITFSIFADKPEIARKQIEVSKQRIASQIEKDGSQPLELERTVSFNYTNMNLHGFVVIARLAEKLGVDLWNYEKDGRSIKKAIAWLEPFAANEKEWKFKQIKPKSYDNTIRIFREAALKYSNPAYGKIAEKLSQTSEPRTLELLSN